MSSSGHFKAPAQGLDDVDGLAVRSRRQQHGHDGNIQPRLTLTRGVQFLGNC